MMLISPEGHKIYCAIRIGFQASNNEVEYKALIAGLQLAKKLQACNLKIHSDSQLVVNQVNNVYQARGDRMTTYLEKAKELMRTFPIASIEVIPRSRNANADALAKLASTRDVELLDAVSVEFLAEYLKIGELAEEKTKAHPLRQKVARYVLYDNKLYKKFYSIYF